MHENPRFLRITGLALKQQLVEDELIDHEMMSVIIRRYSQSDQEADKHSPYLTWRHPLEPEFSVSHTLFFTLVENLATQISIFIY